MFPPQFCLRSVTQPRKQSSQKHQGRYLAPAHPGPHVRDEEFFATRTPSPHMDGRAEAAGTVHLILRGQCRPGTCIEHRPPVDSRTVTNISADEKAEPYRGEQPFGMLDDLVRPGALDLDADPDLWVPQADGVAFRPLLLSVSQGYFVNILRVRGAGILSRHRHTGPVHAFTLRGAWHYLEHSWTARAGGYSFEPPGNIHTLEVLDSGTDMYTLFHVTGAYVYVDPDGEPVGIEDVFSKIDKARWHYASVGLGEDAVSALIR